jgi:cellulose synthase/poly-beta-1,6-N-acetylglucosamine synthase-like glycosyltransferase
MKLSFIIPAHNEEKLIGQALSNLTKINWSKEIIVGLDGCTDKTKDIAQQYNVKIIENKQRQGKPAMLKKLLKQATGDIIIIHDADWKFVHTQESVKNMVNCFKDPKIGAVDFPDPHPYLDDKQKRKKLPFLFLGTAWGSKIVTKYQKEHYTKKVGRQTIIDKEKMLFPFMVGVFRTELKDAIINQIDTPNEDAAITLVILEKGYDIEILDRTYPYFEVMDRTASLPGILKQKSRGQFGWQQISNNFHLKLNGFYPKIGFYFLKEIIKTKDLRSMISIVIWLFLTSVALFKGKKMYKKGVKTKQAWSYRIGRVAND